MTSHAPRVLHKLNSTMNGYPDDEVYLGKLQYAALMGQLTKVNELLEKQKPAKAEWIEALTWAVGAGNDEVVKALLEANECSTKDKETDHDEMIDFLLVDFVFVAVTLGYHRVIKALLEKRVITANVQIPKRGTLLHCAAESGKMEIMDELLGRLENKDCNPTNKFGRHPMHLAAMHGHVEILEKWLPPLDNAKRNKKGPPSDRTTSEGPNVTSLQDKNNATLRDEINHHTPMHFAAYGGHKKVVELLVGHEASINAKNKDGQTPLHYAVRNGHKTTVFWFWMYGANVKQGIRDNNQLTPLLLAAPHDEVFGFLRKARFLHLPLWVRRFILRFWRWVRPRGAGQTKTPSGKDSTQPEKDKKYHEKDKKYQWTQLTNESGLTQLHWAILSKRERDVERLLKLGSDVNWPIQSGTELTPLHCAAAVKHGNIVRILIKNEADVDPKTKLTERTPLHLAAHHGYDDVVNQLLFSGADKDATDFADATPLHLASVRGHEAVVRILLKSGANAKARDNTGLTSLHCAILSKHETIVRELLKHQAAPNAKDDEGLTPLSLVIRQDDENIVRELLKHQADPNAKDDEGLTPLHAAISNDNENMVRELLKHQVLKHRADPNAKDDAGFTPLHWAILKDNATIVRELLALNYNTDVNLTSLHEYTPLHSAAEWGRTAAMQLLLEHPDIRVNKGNIERNTPLHLAARGGRTAVMQLLLEHPDIRVNERNEDGLTPLHMAAAFGTTASMKWLLKHPDIRVDEQDNDGNSPLHAALMVWFSFEEDNVLRTDNGERFPATVMQTLGKMKLLLSCPDTKINECNKRGRTVLNLAYWCHHHIRLYDPESESSKEKLQLLIEIGQLLFTYGAHAQGAEME